MAPELRGFGRSSKPDRVAAPQTYAEDLLALADLLGRGPEGVRWTRRFTLVAHDVGAFVTQILAGAHPRLVRRLFFFSCQYDEIGGRWVQRGQFRETWYQTFHQLDRAAELVGTSRDTCRLCLSSLGLAPGTARTPVSVGAQFRARRRRSSTRRRMSSGDGTVPACGPSGPRGSKTISGI